MAAFKRYLSFGFWKHALGMGEGVERDGMGGFDKMASLSGMPPQETMILLIHKAMRLNEQGVETPGTRTNVGPRAPLDLSVAVDENLKARSTFDASGPGARREYVEWILEAKREETRQRRIAQAVDGGKQATHWKYQDR